MIDLEDYRGPETSIRVYDGALSRERCEYLLAAFRADRGGHHRGVTAGGYLPQVKLTTDLRVGARQLVYPKVWDSARSMIRSAVMDTWGRYQKSVPGASRLRGPFEDTGYQIQHYARGRGRYGPHVDASGWETAFRCGSCVLYLNTVNEGGGTRFPELGVRVKAKQGRLIWFLPSVAWLHGGEVPLSGDKVIVSTFMCFKGYTLLVEGGALHEDLVKAQEK